MRRVPSPQVRSTPVLRIDHQQHIHMLQSLLALHAAISNQQVPACLQCIESSSQLVSQSSQRVWERHLPENTLDFHNDVLHTALHLPHRQLCICTYVNTVYSLLMQFA
jgi:hypothetical protein